MAESGEGRRADAAELARRGYVTFAPDPAPDLFGYGETVLRDGRTRPAHVRRARP